jgi:hypothetical protein
MNSSPLGFSSAPAAALQSKEIAWVSRSVLQPGPRSAKTAWVELEQHVAVGDLLIVVAETYRTIPDVDWQPDDVRHFLRAWWRNIRRQQAVATQNAILPSFPFRLASCHLSPTSTLPPAAPRRSWIYRQDCGGRLMDGRSVGFLTARTSAVGFKSALGAASARTLVD